jgi:5-methylcytosine-specific restriction endonuclease McrA
MGKLTSIERKVATLDLRRGAPAAVERIRGGRQRKIRERIMLRDLYTCRMCGHVTAHGEVDHVVPLHMGGGNNEENLQYL